MMNCSDRAGSSLSSSDGHQLSFNHPASSSRALSSNPTDPTVLALEQPWTPQIERDLFDYGPVPERDLSLNEHRASRREVGIEQDSSSCVTHPQNRFCVESLPLGHNSRQIPAVASSHAADSRSGKISLPGTPSQDQQSMGNEVSTMLRKSRSRIFREGQADSPETTISDAAPSPPRLLPRQSTVSPFAFAPPSSRTTSFRRGDDGESTLAGDTSPTRDSKLQKLPRLDEASRPAPRTPNIPHSETPVLSVTAPTPGSTGVTQSDPAVDPRIPSLTLSPPLSPRQNAQLRPSSTVSHAPTIARNPFSQPQTPIQVPAPPLFITHFECYQGHRKMFRLSNKHYTVPCMACKGTNIADHWKCVWCYLWICATCMDGLRQTEGRSLSALMDKIAKRKENHWSSMGGKKERIREKGGTEESGTPATTEANNE